MAQVEGSGTAQDMFMRLVEPLHAPALQSNNTSPKLEGSPVTGPKGWVIENGMLELVIEF
jgi:hypothetical protein